MLTNNRKICDNVHIVKSIEDKASGTYISIHTVEKPTGNEKKVCWPKFKLN